MSAIGAGAGDAGIVDQEIDGAEAGLGGVEGRGNGVGIGHVEGDGGGARAEACGLRREALPAPGGQHDPGAGGVQDAGEVQAEAAGGAGHQRGAAGEIEGVRGRRHRAQPSGVAVPAPAVLGVALGVPVGWPSAQRPS